MGQCNTCLQLTPYRNLVPLPKTGNQTQIQLEKRMGTIRRAAGSKTKFVALFVPLLIAVISCEPLFQLFLQLLHGSNRGDGILDAKLFATFLARNNFRIRSLGHFALA